MKWTQAKKECKALGFTLRATGFGDYVFYRIGTNENHPSAYFTTCANDALETCRAMVSDMSWRFTAK